MRRERLNFRLPVELVRLVRERCVGEGVSFTELVIRGLVLVLVRAKGIKE